MTENANAEITAIGAVPIDDPAAPPTLHIARGEADSEVREIVSEWTHDAELKSLFADVLLPLNSRIRDAASAQAEATAADLAPIWDRGRDVALLPVDAQDQYRGRLHGIETDLRAGVIGERGAKEQAQIEKWNLENRLAKADERMAGVLQMADNHGPVGLRTTPSAEDIAQAGLVFTKFPHASAPGFIREALARLDTASDPTASQTERSKANYELANAWLPLMERRANSPERFARRFAPVAEQVHGMIKTHLDTATGVTRARSAAEVKAAIQSEYKTMKQMLPAMQHAKDYVILGAPGLFPK